MTERQMLEDLLHDAEAIVAKLRARLAELPDEDNGSTVDAKTSDAIERVQSQKTPDDTGNW